MKKVLAFSITGLMLLFLIFAGLYAIFVEKQNLNFDKEETISIVAWNLQIFGDKKANNTELMNKYVSILDGYDIIIIQEIRDADGSAFDILCNKFEDYTCEISSRAGRSTSKEQYGVLYHTSSEIMLSKIKDYNPDEQDRWERPPVRFDFINQNSENNYVFSIYVSHIKPDDAKNEIILLEKLINSESENLTTNNIIKNTIIVGDLNADCSYYDESEKDFEEWNWIIKDTDDTTIAKSSCAYDRIIVNDEMFNEVITYDINKMTTAEMSDHHPVSLIIRDEEYVRDTSFKKFILWLVGS